jgi:hypothetical protein
MERHHLWCAAVTLQNDAAELLHNAASRTEYVLQCSACIDELCILAPQPNFS